MQNANIVAQTQLLLLIELIYLLAVQLEILGVLHDVICVLYIDSRTHKVTYVV